MHIQVSIGEQTLTLYHDGSELITYNISTAANGPGEQQGSNCTPRGRHYIRAAIGEDLPRGAVFRGRRFTGEIWTPQLGESHPERDWILSRILWLSGLEPGFNRLGNVDSMRRFIYIHGTPDTEPMGVPASHGCIRMRNDEVMDLFDRVGPGCPVTIHE